MYYAFGVSIIAEFFTSNLRGWKWRDVTHHPQSLSFINNTYIQLLSNVESGEMS